MKRIKFAFQAGHSRSYYVQASELAGMSPMDEIFDITDVNGRRVVVYRNTLARIEVWDEEPPPPQ